MSKNILQEFLDDTLNEVGTTTVRVTKKTKINQHAGISAMRLARDSGDPLYTRYRKYKEMYLALKNKILTKYARRAIRIARKELG